MSDFRYIKHDKLRPHVNAIFKDIYSSKYLEEIIKEMSALFNDDTIDRNECKKYIYAIAQELVHNGFRFTSDGFPIPSNWGMSYDADIPIKEWLIRANPSLAERPSIIPKHWGYQSRDLVEFVHENFDKFKDSGRAVHTDDLTTVLGFDNIGKIYGVFTNDPAPKRIPPATIVFHTGNPLDGINGISIESLLAICKNRLETFNAQGFACKENDIAIECCTAAIESLQTRQKRRKEENKAGTQEK